MGDITTRLSKSHFDTLERAGERKRKKLASSREDLVFARWRCLAISFTVENTLVWYILWLARVL
jgi:hypothetical protein